MSGRTLPAQFKPYVKGWWGHILWLNSHFFIGIIGIFLPALIASGLIGLNQTKIVALAAAVISGLQSFLRCDARADRYHAAWRKINAARLRFENDENYPLSEVITAYENGERLIESAFMPVRLPSSETEPSGP